MDVDERPDVLAWFLEGMTDEELKTMLLEMAEDDEELRLWLLAYC